MNDGVVVVIYGYGGVPRPMQPTMYCVWLWLCQMFVYFLLFLLLKFLISSLNTKSCPICCSFMLSIRSTTLSDGEEDGGRCCCCASFCKAMSSTPICFSNVSLYRVHSAINGFTKDASAVLCRRNSSFT